MTAVTPATMDHSPLNDLPAELRNEIYGYVLEMPGDVEIDRSDWRVTNNPVKTDLQSATALLSTCRQVHHEGLPILLSANRFVFESHFSGNSDRDEDEDTLDQISDLLQGWIEGFRRYSTHLKHVELTTCGWYAYRYHDDYLCDFYPSALKCLSHVFKETLAKPTLRIEIRCGNKYYCTDSLVVGRDNQQAKEAVQTAQKDMDSSVDFLSGDPSNAKLIGEIKTSKKTLQRFLLALQASE